MTGHVRALVVPSFLTLCLLLGGSSQGAWANLALRLLAIATLAWTFFQSRTDTVSRNERPLTLIICAAVSLVGLQLIPLPPGLWTALPGRGPIGSGYALLGQPLPWLPISLAPYATLTTVLAVLPALAVIAAMLRLRGYTPKGIAWGIAAATVAGIVLSVAQLTTLDAASQRSSWYLYPVVNLGAANGFFANSNHMATLLLACLPFLAALLVAYGGSLGPQAAIAGIGLSVLGALAWNGSMAGLLLGVPVLCGSLLITFKARSMGPKTIALGITGMALAGVAFVQVTGLRASHGADVSIESRKQIYSTAVSIANDHLPIGSGLGTFRKIYPSYEDSNRVDRTFVNHAHNDYLELIVELGLFGLALIGIFLLWWVTVAVRAWHRSNKDPFARAATVASAAILAHSLVDFPLRTAAISALFAACLALMVRPWSAPADNSVRDLRPSRHLTVD